MIVERPGIYVSKVLTGRDAVRLFSSFVLLRYKFLFFAPILKIFLNGAIISSQPNSRCKF